MNPVEILLWFTVPALIVYIAYEITKRLLPGAKRYVRSEQGEPLEVDLRLTYKRFKELYPFSTISYQDYKKLQMKRAFKRAVSSEKNKRMVR